MKKDKLKSPHPSVRFDGVGDSGKTYLSRVTEAIRDLQSGSLSNLAQSGAEDGQAIVWDSSIGSWAPGLPAPAGGDTQIQFNNNGDMGASEFLTWLPDSEILRIIGGLQIGAGSVDSFLRFGGSRFTYNLAYDVPLDFEINCGANKTTFLTEGVYEDANVGGISLSMAAANPPVLFTLPTTSIKTYGFEGGGPLEEAHGGFELPHSYQSGTDVHPHLHVYKEDTTAGDVKFGLDVLISGPTVGTHTFSRAGITATGGIIDFGTISGSYLEIGAQIFLRIYRDSSDPEDTYPNIAFIGTLGIHYKADTLGSRMILSK